jgi:hypothetical protein
MRRNHDFLDHRDRLDRNRDRKHDRLDRNRDHDRDTHDARYFWLIVGTWIIGSATAAVALLQLA